MNEDLKEKLKSISIKIILTPVALLIGFIAGILVMFKPLKDLWTRKTDFERAVEEALEK